MVDHERPATQDETTPEPVEGISPGADDVHESVSTDGIGGADQPSVEDDTSVQVELSREDTEEPLPSVDPDVDKPPEAEHVPEPADTAAGGVDAEESGPAEAEAVLEVATEVVEEITVTETAEEPRPQPALPQTPVAPMSLQDEPAWLPPEFEQQEERAVSPPLGRSPGRLPAVILALLMSGVFAMFLLIEPTPTWLALFGALVAALGTDGVLRSIRRQVFEADEGPDTVPHLFLPALFALAIPLFIEENLQGYWVLPAALIAGFAFVLVVLAEVPAEAAEDEFRGRARFVSVAGTYFVAFTLFSLTYAFDLGLRDALIATALVTVLLAVELLREGEIDPLETLLLAGVVGVVVAEARWVLHFMPLDEYPAGLALLLTFYFVTGMVHAYMTRHINVTVAVEYSVVTALGIALVIAARATGVA